ncbi:uncharacterized protein PODANS_7_7000 [Podospora anserina S mat+]|uniref:Podospora anserina S mat+ genomic DNA chromosome 7, supercontig 1 n=1 Tax=Podospora anserina (strain S / ATCC MYA-4624 / DSM 980 / FGSC 10383) TaxID=515849 RepID=B2AWF7_PODAN|nr:uncharacterized protein PODANS_7_7000 [Podospora anserina S mat+]CAP68731.1 unnamed protein product [Podospora anserina S mat+]
MAEPSPSTNAGPNTAVIHDDPDSDDDEVLDIGKVLRQKANSSKPSTTRATLDPPPPGSLAAEAQARPVPETPAKKRGLGWLDESPITPAVGINTTTDTPVTVPHQNQSAHRQAIPSRASVTSPEAQREHNRSNRSKEERERERLETLEKLNARRQAIKTRASDDGRSQGGHPSSSRLPVVDLRTPSASKVPSVADTSSSRRSRVKLEERRRRKEMEKATREAKRSRQKSTPSQPPPSQPPPSQPPPSQPPSSTPPPSPPPPPPPTFQTAEPRAVDREISRAIRHTPITAGEAAERRPNEIKAHGAEVYRSGANRGTLIVDSLEETETTGADEAVFVQAKRLAEAEARKPKTRVVTGMESDDVQQDARPYGVSRDQPASAGPSRLQQPRNQGSGAITTPTRGRKCDRCTRMKRPCTFGQPCSRCQIADVQCVYFSNVGRLDLQPAERPERPETESFVDQQYRLSLPQPGFQESQPISMPPPPPRPVRQCRPPPPPRPPPPRPRSPSCSPPPEPGSPATDAVSAIDVFGEDRIVYQYVVYRTQKLPVVEGEEDPEEKRGDYAIRCSEHSKLADANRQVEVRMQRPKKGVVAKGWKYRPGLDEAQRPGLMDVRVVYGKEGGVELFWVEVETRDLTGVVEVRGGRGRGELMVERVAGEVYRRWRFDVWGVVVVKREDLAVRKREQRLVFDCGGVEDRGVQTGEEMEAGGVQDGEDMEVDDEVEVEEEVGVEENVAVEEDVEMTNFGDGMEEETPIEAAGESQLTDTTQADTQNTTDAAPKKDLPNWHPDYYADSNESDDDDDDDDDDEDHVFPFECNPPYNPPTPLILPPQTNVLDLLTVTPTLHGSYTSPHRANIAALRVLLSEARPRNNYMNDNIHYSSVFKPTQMLQFEEDGLDQEMTRALFNVTWRPPGDTPTEKYKWEFEELRVWVTETELKGAIDLSDFVVRDGEGDGWVVRKGKKKAVAEEVENGVENRVEQVVEEVEGEASEEE